MTQVISRLSSSTKAAAPATKASTAYSSRPRDAHGREAALGNETCCAGTSARTPLRPAARAALLDVDGKGNVRDSETALGSPGGGLTALFSRSYKWLARFVGCLELPAMPIYPQRGVS